MLPECGVQELDAIIKGVAIVKSCTAHYNPYLLRRFGKDSTFVIAYSGSDAQRFNLKRLNSGTMPYAMLIPLATLLRDATWKGIKIRGSDSLDKSSKD